MAIFLSFVFFLLFLLCCNACAFFLPKDFITINFTISLGSKISSLLLRNKFSNLLVLRQLLD
jgi:hypothetical protein